MVDCRCYWFFIMEIAYLFHGILLTFLITTVAYYKPIAEGIESFISNYRDNWFVRFLSFISVIVYYLIVFITLFLSLFLIYIILLILFLSSVYALEYLGVISIELENSLSDLLGEDRYLFVVGLFKLVLLAVGNGMCILAMNIRRSYYLKQFAFDNFREVKKSSLFYIILTLSTLFYFIFSLPFQLMSLLMDYVAGRYFSIDFTQQINLSYAEDVNPGLMVINISLAYSIVSICLCYRHLTYIKELESTKLNTQVDEC